MIKLFNIWIAPILLYGSEIWSAHFLSIAVTDRRGIDGQRKDTQGFKLLKHTKKTEVKILEPITSKDIKVKRNKENKLKAAAPEVPSPKKVK